MSPSNTLLLATTNAGKVRELSQMVASTGIEVVGLDAFPSVVEVDETGGTFAENARLKAVGYAQQTGLPALADDSGLEVESLGGRPGVLSARYGGVGLSYPERMRMLLDELRAARPDDRGARFVCSMAFAAADGTLIGSVSGICRGRIADETRGNGGFGYDPLFIPDGHDATFGELPEREKARLSHRGRAFLQIMPILRDFFRKLT